MQLDQRPCKLAATGTALLLALPLGAYAGAAPESPAASWSWGWNDFGQNGYGHQMPLGDDELPTDIPDLPLLVAP